MNIYGELYESIQDFRRKGYTSSEINEKLHTPIPKSSLSYICKGIYLTENQQQRTANDASVRLAASQLKAVAANRKKFERKLQEFRNSNNNLLEFMTNKRAQKIALAMLYLGEGAKWQKSRAPKLTSTSPMIIKLYIMLLSDYYSVTIDRLHCRIQHRDDQNEVELVKYWSSETGISPTRIYKSYVDKRTKGHVTKKDNYHGVCTIT